MNFEWVKIKEKIADYPITRYATPLDRRLENVEAHLMHTLFYWNSVFKAGEFLLVKRRYLEKCFGGNLRGDNTNKFICKLSEISQNHFNIEYFCTKKIFRFQLIKDLKDWGVKI